MQHARGIIDGCANGWLWSPGRQSTPNSKLGRLLWAKTVLSAYYIRVTKWLVTCLQSNPVGTNFAGFCSNLGARWLFSSLAGFLLGVYWLAGSTSPSGGGESHHFTETKTQVPAACQPQPRQPHNGKYHPLRASTQLVYLLIKIHQHPPKESTRSHKARGPS